jgi:hypothetical protein
MDMTRWITFPGALEMFDKKTIKASVIIPGDGAYNGKGEIWVRSSSSPDKVAITVVFENCDRTGGTQYRFYLTEDQARQIQPCKDKSFDFEFIGDLIPVDIKE